MLNLEYKLLVILSMDKLFSARSLLLESIKQNVKL
jgi:hypothetical protein